MIYLYELDEFLHNFIESGDQKQIEISRDIVMSIFSALENENNSALIKSLTTSSNKISSISPSNMNFINITYILGNSFSLQPSEFFDKQNDKQNAALISKARKDFKDSITLLPQTLLHFVPLSEHFAQPQTDPFKNKAQASQIKPPNTPTNATE